MKGTTREFTDKEQEDKKMPVVEELIRTEQDGTISFGNYKLGQKSKKSDLNTREISIRLKLTTKSQN